MPIFLVIVIVIVNYPTLVEIVQKTTNLGTWSAFWGS